MVWKEDQRETYGIVFVDAFVGVPIGDLGNSDDVVEENGG